MVTIDGDQTAVKQEEKAAVSELDVSFQIASQIEYYFADVNLRKDKFMKEEIAKDNGWVPIATLMTFNRMKALTEDAAVVIKSLKTPHANVQETIELNEDETKIRRKVPFVDLTDEQVAEMNNRTIHFKGITQDATLDEIRSFCSQYGKVVSIEMRRLREDRKFKGCVMCVYSTLEEANAALAGTEVYDENIEFKRENKNAWQERKDRMFEARKSKKVKKEDGVDGEVKKEEEVDEKEDADPVRVKGTILVLDGVDPSLRFDVLKTFFRKHGAVAYVEVEKATERAFIRFSNENEAASVIKTATIKRDEANGSAEKGEKSEADAAEKVEGANGDSEAAENKTETVPQTDAADERAPVKDEEDDGAVRIEINGSKYKASILTGEEEVTYWRGVIKAKKQAALNPRSDHHRSSYGNRSRGRGFKRGGKGYQGRNNDRSGDFKRKTRSDGASESKKAKSE